MGSAAIRASQQAGHDRNAGHDLSCSYGANPCIRPQKMRERTWKFPHTILRFKITSLIALVLFGIFAGFLRIGYAEELVASPYTVFLRRVPSDPTLCEVILVDMLTGEEITVEARGERFSVMGGTVLYYDPARAQIMRITTDGEISPHPFMQITATGAADLTARRLDWIASPDGKLLAWTQTNADSAGRLSTITWVASSDGSDQRVVLTDGPRDDGLRVMPVAFGSSRTRLLMDYQPDGLTALTPYPQFAGLFALDLTETDAVPQFLPGEPGDFTGAGFGAGYFLRLALSADRSAFDVRIYNLDSDLEWTIPAMRLRGFTQAGDFLVSPDGTYAVYALSQITGFGTPTQAIQTVFMLVDLTDMSQRELTDPITEFVRTAAWTEDNTAVIFTSPQRDGTWKVNLSDRQLVKVAEATYLGMLQAAD